MQYLFSTSGFFKRLWPTWLNADLTGTQWYRLVSHKSLMSVYLKKKKNPKKQLQSGSSCLADKVVPRSKGSTLKATVLTVFWWNLENLKLWKHRNLSKYVQTIFRCIYSNIHIITMHYVLILKYFWCSHQNSVHFIYHMRKIFLSSSIALKNKRTLSFFLNKWHHVSSQKINIK